MSGRPDTIFALASGSRRAGVAVFRVSGAGAAQSAAALCGRNDFVPRQASLATLRAPDTGTIIDRALVLYFKAPASFTGEDIVEYHLHGGASVIAALTAALSKQPLHRLAEPGEFTKRAFENGKIDLTEAEAVADLIAAETEAQRLQALDQLGGGLSRLYRAWTERLTKILAHQEADIEFPEDDLPQGLSTTLVPLISALQNEIDIHLQDSRRGERLRDGIRVAIVGAPNAGKSSLLNALMSRDVAIVSDEAGTTRDVIEAHLDLGGYPVILADTAGLRATDNRIEAEGIKRARDNAAIADIKLALFDATVPRDPETLALVDDKTIVVLTKSDLAAPQATDALAISVKAGTGMDALLQTLAVRVAEMFGRNTGAVPTRERHRTALEEARECLARAINAPLPELAAEDLRLAVRAIGRITGRVHVEDVLDRIFRDFCIGK